MPTARPDEQVDEITPNVPPEQSHAPTARPDEQVDEITPNVHAPTARPDEQVDEITPNVPPEQSHAPQRNSESDDAADGSTTPQRTSRAGDGTDAPAGASSASNPPQEIAPLRIQSLTNEELRVLESIVNQLGLLQDSTGLKHLFHLFAETDASHEISLGNESGIPASRYIKVITKLLFSPTISLSKSTEYRRMRTEDLARAINVSSFLMRNQEEECGRDRTEPATPHQPIRRRASFPLAFLDPPAPEAGGNIQPTLEQVRIPSWFPYEGKEYKTPPQYSNDMLLIPEDNARKFLEYTDSDGILLYRVFFDFLHQQAKSLCPSYKKGTLKYSMFTPPWLRRHLSFGNEVVTMENVVIHDQKSHRNKQGYRRRKLLLAAFYSHEPHFGTSILDHLTNRLPVLRRAEKRRKATNEAVRQSVTTPTTLDRVGRQEVIARTQQTPTVVDLTEDQTEPPANSVERSNVQQQRRSNVRQQRSSAGRGTRGRGPQPPPTKITLDNEEHVAALREAMNPPAYAQKDYGQQLQEVGRYRQLCEELVAQRDQGKTLDERVETEIKLLEAEFERDEAEKEQAKANDRRARVARGLFEFLQSQREQENIRKTAQQRRKATQSEAAPNQPNVPQGGPVPGLQAPKRKADAPRASKPAKKSKHSSAGSVSPVNTSEREPQPSSPQASQQEAHPSSPQASQKAAQQSSSIAAQQEAQLPRQLPSTQTTQVPRASGQPVDGEDSEDLPTLEELSDMLRYNDLTGSESESGSPKDDSIIKCGGFLRCQWKLTPGMQELKHLKAKCKKCGICMHVGCLGRRRLCSKCLKARIFKRLLREEQR